MKFNSTKIIFNLVLFLCSSIFISGCASLLHSRGEVYGEKILKNTQTFLRAKKILVAKEDNYYHVTVKVYSSLNLPSTTSIFQVYENSQETDDLIFNSRITESLQETGYATKYSSDKLQITVKCLKNECRASFSPNIVDSFGNITLTATELHDDKVIKRLAKEEAARKAANKLAADNKNAIRIIKNFYVARGSYCKKIPDAIEWDTNQLRYLTSQAGIASMYSEPEYSSRRIKNNVHSVSISRGVRTRMFIFGNVNETNVTSKLGRFRVNLKTKKISGLDEAGKGKVASSKGCEKHNK